MAPRSTTLDATLLHDAADGPGRVRCGPSASCCRAVSAHGTYTHALEEVRDQLAAVGVADPNLWHAKRERQGFAHAEEVTACPRDPQHHKQSGYPAAAWCPDGVGRYGRERHPDIRRTPERLLQVAPPSD